MNEDTEEQLQLRPSITATKQQIILIAQFFQVLLHSIFVKKNHGYF